MPYIDDAKGCYTLRSTWLLYNNIRKVMTHIDNGCAANEARALGASSHIMALVSQNGMFRLTSKCT